MTKCHFFLESENHRALCHPATRNNLEQEVWDYLTNGFSFPEAHLCSNCRRRLNFLLECDPTFRQMRTTPKPQEVEQDAEQDETPLTLPRGLTDPEPA